MAWTLAEQAEFAALKRHKLGLLLGDGCAMKGANVDQEAARDLQTRLRKALGNLVRRLASVSKEMQTCRVVVASAVAYASKRGRIRAWAGVESTQGWMGTL